MPTRLTTVVFDALHPDALAAFWAEVLGWGISTDDDGDVRAQPPSGNFPNLLFMSSTAPKLAKNRAHLDLDAGPGQAETVERLTGLGARRLDIGQGDVSWVVMADPEGNELCVLAKPGGAMPSVTAICLDSQDLGLQGRFWGAATGWVPDAEGPWGISLRAASGDGPSLVMGPPVAPKSSKNRVHLDVAPWPGDDQAAEVRRLRALGARPVDVGQGDVSWVVMADPEGNELCVLAPL